ncbi:MAG: ABC transporter substrate-binding protein, partial [Chloroflexota bacterium]
MKPIRIASLLAAAGTLLAACGGSATVSAPSTSPSLGASVSVSAGSSAKPAASSSAAGSAVPASSAAPGGKSPIKIGSLADTSSTFAVLGAETHVVTDMVVGQINTAGGIDGHPLAVTYADPKSDPAQALQLATELVQKDNVDVLMGANGSAECLGVAQLAPKLGVVYLPTAGCAADEFTTKNCNANTFRVSLATTQQLNAEAATLVSKYGKNWGVLYPDYAFGQSQLNSFQTALQPLGGQVKAQIATPLNETNLNPYISKIPTDGSIDGLLDAQGGADLVRGLQAMQQFGILKKVPIFLGSGGREFFGGVYPSAVDGVLLGGVEPSKAPADYPYLQAFQKA